MLGRDRSHRARLSFEYDDPNRAVTVARAILVEVDEIDDDRSTATVDRDGEVVVVSVAADDLTALRAGLNTWSRLVSAAETTAEAAR